MGTMITGAAMRAGISGEVTIESVRVQRGWDACDHMIDDTRADALAGTRHRSVTAAVRAADATTGRHSCAATIVLVAGGRRYRVDTSALLQIPGRHVPIIVALPAAGE